MPRTSTLIIFAAATALAAAGCDRDQKSASKDRAGESGPAKEKEGTAGASARAEEAGAEGEGRGAPPPDERLAVLPASADFVLSLSLSGLRQSEVFRAYRDRLLGDAARGFEAFERACGVSPMEAFDSLLAGGKAAAEKEIILVLTGMKRTELERCAEKLAAGADRELSITRRGELTRFESGRGALWAAWLDDHTLVATMHPDEAFLAARVRGDGGLAKEGELSDLLAEIDRDATAWLVARPAGGSGVTAELGGIASEAEGFFASLSLGGGLALHGGLRMASPKAARKAAGMAVQMLGAVKRRAKPLSDFAEKVEIADKERDVVIRLDLSEKELQDLRRTLEKLAQDMGGMMSGM